MDKATKRRLALAEFLEKGSKRFDAIEGMLKTHAAQIRAIEGIRERLPGVNGNKGDRFRFSAVIRGMVNGGLDCAAAWVGAEHEREVGMETRKRALLQGTDSAGGYVVPNEYIAQIIPELVAATVVLESGATQMTGLDGTPVEIPRLASGATAEWGVENTTITDSDQTLEQITLSPHMARAMTYMSRRVVAMSNPSIEAMVRADLIGVIARALDIAALRGTGAASQPTGISNLGVTVTSLAGTPTIDALYDTLYRLEADDVPEDKIGWVMNPREWNTLRQLKDANNQYYVQPDVTGKAKGFLFGFPIRTTTAIPINLGAGNNESEIYLGAWSELIWAMFGNMVVEATTEGGDTFAKHQVGVKVVTECDFNVRHTESFEVLDQVQA